MNGDYEHRFGNNAYKEDDDRCDDLWNEVDRRGGGVEAKTFTSTQLRRIGEVCSKRLPPASTVKAMFLYELQRESEVESLFQDQMFRLAKQDDKSTEQEKRIAALEARLAQIEKAAVSRDVEERLATSKLTMKVHQGKIDTCTGQVKALEGKVSAVQKDIEALRSQQEEAAGKPIEEETSGPNVETMEQEINVLFDDRDGILGMIAEVNDRIVTLGDTVRALTIEGTTIKTPSPFPQLIPVQDGNVEVVQDLSVPKSKAHVSMKEDRKLSAIRSFSPGKQWAT